jgi:hypothetical protein
MAVYICNPSIGEAKVGRFQIQGQPELHKQVSGLLKLHSEALSQKRKKKMTSCHFVGQKFELSVSHSQGRCSTT